MGCGRRAAHLVGRHHRSRSVRMTRRYLPLNHNPLPLIQRDLISTSIIEARRARTFMVGHLLGDFELPTIPQISVILVARKE